MGKYDRLACAFCNHQPGEWKKCPNCGAPKTGTGTWLAKRWKVPLAKNLLVDSKQALLFIETVTIGTD